MWFRNQASTWTSTWTSTWQDFPWSEFDWKGLARQWSSGQGPSFQDFAEWSQRLAADEGELRRRVWRKLKREAANIPFVEDALTAHYCAFDRNTPLYVKLALAGAVVYFLVPDDLIPDSIPVLGLVDDAAVLAGAMKIFASHIKPEHREAAKLMLERMRKA